MHIAILTFEGFNELDSLIALGILNRIRKPDWRVSIASPGPRVRSMNGEQVVMANTKLLEREIHNMALAKARRVTLYLAVAGEASASSIDAVGAAAEAAVSAQKGCKLIRCARAGAGGGGLAFDLVYDDATRDSDKLAADRAAILRSLIEALQGHKLQLARASDQPPAPLPF